MLVKIYNKITKIDIDKNISRYHNNDIVNKMIGYIQDIPIIQHGELLHSSKHM